ncbi:replication initiation factor domain-containing protein [Proteocatella sphenisci]|uniref:replication initiation factor domain-containing protein n=1 Tax=Proteocatella sphenisci TaxID=181070 RepID=UPI00048F83E8|nr:replication initiation factor domain-containing protein [Proteocatella sphenisci]
MQRTKEKNEIICDWLEYTALTDVREIDSEKEKIKSWGYDVKKMKALDTGLFGYKNRLFFNGQSILYNGNYGMRVHFIMSGKGVRYYESENDTVNLIKTLVYEEENVNFSRIDLAMDIKDESIDFETMLEYLYKNNIVTRFKQYKYIAEKEISEDSQITTGESIYFGSRTSDLYIRIYDKAKEQENFDANWIRIEIVYKRERANTLAIYLAENEKTVGHIFSATLNNYIRFVNPTADTNKRRWPMALWWKNILETSQSISLSMKPEEIDIDKLESWVNKQVAPSLAVIKEYYQGDMKKIEEIIINGTERINPKYQRFLDEIKSAAN